MMRRGERSILRIRLQESATKFLDNLELPSNKLHETGLSATEAPRSLDARGHFHFVPSGNVGTSRLPVLGRRQHFRGVKLAPSALASWVAARPPSCPKRPAYQWAALVENDLQLAVMLSTNFRELSSKITRPSEIRSRCHQKRVISLETFVYLLGHGSFETNAAEFPTAEEPDPI